MRTTFPQEIEVSGVTDTAPTQETAESESAKVKFPKRIKHRGRVLATIYAKCKGRDSYRVAWQVLWLVVHGQKAFAEMPAGWWRGVFMEPTSQYNTPIAASLHALVVRTIPAELWVEPADLTPVHCQTHW